MTGRKEYEPADCPAPPPEPRRKLGRPKIDRPQQPPAAPPALADSADQPPIKRGRGRPRKALAALTPPPPPPMPAPIDAPPPGDTAAKFPRIAYSLEEIIAMTGVGRTTLYLDIKAGHLIARKIGSRRVLILAEDLAAYMRSLPRLVSGDARKAS